MNPGQIVFAKCGRDKGRLMVVLAVAEGYAYLADGRLRLIKKPKRKKLKHIQLTNTIVNLTPSCGRTLQDADIRKLLTNYYMSNKIM